MNPGQSNSEAPKNGAEPHAAKETAHDLLIKIDAKVTNIADDLQKHKEASAAQFTTLKEAIADNKLRTHQVETVQRVETADKARRWDSLSEDAVRQQLALEAEEAKAKNANRSALYKILGVLAGGVATGVAGKEVLSRLLALFVVLPVLFLCGCVNAQTERIVSVTLDYVVATNQIALLAYKTELAVCAGSADREARAQDIEACIADVEKRWETYIQVSESLHQVWCETSPSSEGCKP